MIGDDRISVREKDAQESRTADFIATVLDVGTSNERVSRKRLHTTVASRRQ